MTAAKYKISIVSLNDTVDLWKLYNSLNDADLWKLYNSLNDTELWKLHIETFKFFIKVF